MNAVWSRSYAQMVVRGLTVSATDHLSGHRSGLHEEGL